MSAEPRWRIALTSWLAVYPTITAVGALTLPFTESLPWAAQTFVMTTIMVPLIVYVTGPAAKALLGAAANVERGLSTRMLSWAAKLRPKTPRHPGGA